MLLEDAGKGNPEDFEISEYSSISRAGILDTGTVDIGYHSAVSDLNNNSMPEAWEKHFGVNDPNADNDGDGVYNYSQWPTLGEYQLATDPKNPDTDGDAWYAGAEWFGQDQEEAGVDARCNGFVEGPARFDPRRPPYLQNMGVDGAQNRAWVTIYWGWDKKQIAEEASWADGESTDRLWLRRSDEGQFSAYSAEAAPDPGPPPQEDKTTVFRRCNLDNLLPHTLYFYKIEFKPTDTSEWRFTPVYTFRTWPPDPSDWRFAVYGDTHASSNSWNYNSDHQKVAEAILRKHQDPPFLFVVCTGDMVFSGNDYIKWNYDFFYPAAKLIRTLPVFVVAGNRDRDQQPEQPFKHMKSFFDFPGEPEGPDFWDYNFQLGKSHLFFVDSGSEGPSDDSVQSLFTGLEQSTKKWRFVFFHIPGYGHVEDYENLEEGTFDSTGMQNVRVKLFNRTEQKYLDKQDPFYVTGVFCGHNDVYEWASVGDEQGLEPLNLFTLGGGGAEPDGILNLKDPPNFPEGVWSPAQRKGFSENFNYGVVRVQYSSQVVIQIYCYDELEGDFVRVNSEVTTRGKP